MNAPLSELARKRERLTAQLSECAPLLVAYSGGVDSTVLLALARETLGESGVLGVLADSPSLPRAALRDALALAERVGARVEVLRTEEMENPDYAANPPNRCYFCKAELFSRMEVFAQSGGWHHLAYGENADDQHQVRPGQRAAAEFQVLAPLRDAELSKADVRELARERDLPNWDAPAQPCLSSRIPHGIPVTAAALARVEQAEAWLREQGFRIFRVRHASAPEETPLARVEIAPEELAKAFAQPQRIEAGIRAAGFEAVEIDPRGYRSPAG